MNARAKPASIRFYVDADLHGLAKILVQVRSDVTYPGDPGGVLHRRERPPCVIESSEVLDTVWIPSVAQQGWLIVTRDSNIAAHRAEIEAVQRSAAKMVALSGREATTTWNQLEILLTQWRSIDALTDRPGPFIYSATRSRLRAVPLS